MDSDVTDLITRFNQLSSPLARHTVYHHILDQLNLYEWRDVRDRLTQVSFHKDILGSLPLEIVVRIVKDLDLSEIHVLRRVSKNWQFLLSSDPVCGTVYRMYTGLHGQSCTVSSSRTLLQYAKQRLRLERGDPVFKIDLSPGIALSSDLDYSTGRYAWINGGSILVHNLRAQTNQVYCTPNRDSFVQMRISEFIVVGLTPRGYCHVWDLQSESSVSFRIPSLNIVLFVASGYNVAIAFNETGGRMEGLNFVLHYDSDSRILRRVDVAPRLGFMAINPATNTLLTVHLEDKIDNDISLPNHHNLANNRRLRVTEHLLNPEGETTPLSSHLPSYTLNLPGAADSICRVSIDYTISHNFGDRIGLFSIQPQDSYTPTPFVVIAISYDPRVDQVALHVLHDEHTPFFPLCIASVGDNILYFLKNDNGKPRFWISNPNALIRHRPATSMDTKLPREATTRVYSYANGLTLTGDRDFILMVDENAIKVWGFGESNQLPTDT
ncbi:hypothetical protein FE257_002147 [Aspergillus nanangensis]|uniref:F-box domain-containing protein n=1 Tax=Aspergillus nanangensis TaxID=2582783 RepID=A0AAD4CTE8_ASPNN|nr:hypothetical protein FE257_002147 [Aspergillus nanangensis]